MHRLLRPLPTRIATLAGLLLLAPARAAAGPGAALADPTRPPAPPATMTAVSPGTAAPRAEPAPPPRLQSVQLGRGGAATALVDGRLLRVGDRLGDTQVAAIDLQGLLLRGPRGTERLWLLAALNQPPPPPLPPTPAPPTVAVAGEK